MDLISLIVGNTVVLMLFSITYFIVNARILQEDTNQLMTAYLTLIEIYEPWANMVEIFSQDDLRERVANRCDGDKYYSEDKVPLHF